MAIEDALDVAQVASPAGEGLHDQEVVGLEDCEHRAKGSDPRRSLDGLQFERREREGDVYVNPRGYMGETNHKVPAGELDFVVKARAEPVGGSTLNEAAQS